MFRKKICTFIICLLCIKFNGNFGLDLMKEPLVFHYLPHDPQKVYIYFDPLVSVSKVTLLSTRDVQYIRNSTSAELKEEFGTTHQLVGEADDDDGTKRYVFVKKSLCHEVDWTIAWIDGKGLPHGPITQRLGPSPVPWRPQVTLRVSPPILNGTSIVLNLNYELADIQLNEREFIVEPVLPYIDLDQCKYTFKKAQRRPEVINSKTISIPTAYVQNECTFWIRLKITVFDDDMGCRIARTTLLDENVAGTDLIKLKCDKVDGLDCVPISSAQSCDMDCSPNYFARAVYDYNTPRPTPMARVSFIPQNTELPIKGWIMRHVQIDRSHFNYPLKEFNVTIERLAKDVMHKDFKPYSKDMGFAYGVQACALYQTCSTEAVANWAYVPQTAVFFNQLIKSLPPATTTSASTSTSRTSSSSEVLPASDNIVEDDWLDLDGPIETTIRPKITKSIPDGIIKEVDEPILNGNPASNPNKPSTPTNPTMGQQKTGYSNSAASKRQSVLPLYFCMVLLKLSLIM